MSGRIGVDPTRAILSTLLAAGAAAVFWPIRGHAWLNYDDNVYVTANEMVQRGLTGASVGWAFSSFQGANWFPLTRLSWMLDVELFGTAAAGFYTTNLVLHALATAILFLALARMTGAPWKSAFVAAVFALHPLHVESVAWISGRKDPLSGLFFALAILFYERLARRGPSPSRHAAVLICLSLGLMAKPILVTLPFVLLLLDAWPLRRLQAEGAPDRFDAARSRACVREKIPAFAVVAIFSAVTFAAQRAGETVASVTQVPFTARVANAVVSYAVYLGKSFWPSGLAVFYPHPEGSLSATSVGLALALLVALTALAGGLWRRAPAIAVGWLWYLGTLVPVIGLVQVGSQARADRYMYLPLIGLSIALAWGVPALFPRLRPALGVLGAAVAVALAAATSVQIESWRDSTALFERALAVTRENAIAHAHLGEARLAEGRASEAVIQWKEAVRIRPDFETAANNLAWLLATHPDAGVRDPEEAIARATVASELTGGRDPVVLDTLAAAYATAGRFSEARATLGRALALAREAGNAPLVSELEPRLALYDANRPYRAPR